MSSSLPMTGSALPLQGQPSFDPRAFLARLEARLDRRQLDRFATARDRVVSLSLSTPALIGAGVHAVRSGDLYWSRPARQELRIGLGHAWSVQASGPHRLACLDRTLQGLVRRWHFYSPDALAPGPVVFAGFAFDADDPMQGPWEGLPNALLQIPELVLERQGAECRLTFSSGPEQHPDPARWRKRWLQLAGNLAERMCDPPKESSPPHLSLEYRNQDGALSQWTQRVAAALDAVARNRLEKLVLTRGVRLQASRALDFGRVLARLDARTPACMHFAVPVQQRILVGATPERLLCIEQDTAVVDAIASTAPRDRELGQAGRDRAELFENRKARREHQLVVNAIIQALGPISTELAVPDHPHLMTLPNVHHLWSPIRARLRPGLTPLAVAERLHPTPAVGGAPRQAAADWLQAHHESRRGWYTGALGWLNPQGTGELGVVLRCALLDAREALLFAGAGIVEGSNAVEEYRETEWKLQSMLDALSHA